MKVVTLTIDGKRIFADAGTTILEAARQNGIHIPTLCHHPRLAPLGHCRICIVEVEGMARPVTACDSPARDGMAVTTHTPLLLQMRQDILAMALSTHPYQDCLTCEKGGACELQEKTYSFGMELPAQMAKEQPAAVRDDNPYITRDAEKCILCGRCVAVCRSGAGRFVFALAGKGVNTRVVAGPSGEDVGLEQAGCIFCGQCVDLCPVGALTEKERAGRGREWEMRPVPGVCVECSLGCPLERKVIDDGLVKVTVPPEGERESRLCVKGKFGINQDSGAEIITVPLVREGDTFREAGYDEALRKAAAVLGRLKQQEGGDSLAVLAAGRCTNEESYLLQKMARSVLGTNHVDLGVEPAYAEAACAVFAAAGSGARAPSMADLEQANAVLVLGGRLAETNPVAAMAVGRAARFGKAVIMEACAGEECGVAESWERLQLEPRPGCEAALLQAITAALKEQPVEELAKDTAVPAGAIERAARLLAGYQSYILVTPAFFRSADSGQVAALLELAAACGQLARGTTNLLLLAGPGNARGILEAGGSPLFLPGCQPLNDHAARLRFTEAWGVEIPEQAGLSREQIAAAVQEDRIKGLFVLGRGFKELVPDGLESLVVQCESRDDIPARADVVFPAQPAHLKQGSFTGADGRVRRSESAGNAAAPIWPDWKLYAALAVALGAPWDYASLKEVQEEIQNSE